MAPWLSNMPATLDDKKFYLHLHISRIIKWLEVSHHLECVVQESIHNPPDCHHKGGVQTVSGTTQWNPADINTKTLVL